MKKFLAVLLLLVAPVAAQTPTGWYSVGSDSYYHYNNPQQLNILCPGQVVTPQTYGYDQPDLSQAFTMNLEIGSRGQYEGPLWDLLCDNLFEFTPPLGVLLVGVKGDWDGFTPINFPSDHIVNAYQWFNPSIGVLPMTYQGTRLKWVPAGYWVTEHYWTYDLHVPLAVQEIIFQTGLVDTVTGGTEVWLSQAHLGVR
jgi:hypothetical protein